MIKKIMILLVIISVASCSKEPSLQQYFVKNSESTDFISVDLGSSIINTEKMELTSKQKNALNSFEKLNILAFKKDSVNEKKFEVEKTEVTTILKDKNYEELMHFGNNKKSGAIYVVGNEETFDEVVLFASDVETGFVVARFLGDDMSPNSVLDLVEVIQKADVDLEALKPLKNAFEK